MQPKFVRKFDSKTQVYNYHKFLGDVFKLGKESKGDIVDLNTIKRDYLNLAGEDVERNGFLVEQLKRFQELVKQKMNNADNFLKVLKALKDCNIIFSDVYDELSILPEVKKPIEPEKKFNLDDILKLAHPEKDVQSILKAIIYNEIDNQDTFKAKNKLLDEIRQQLLTIDWRAFSDDFDKIPTIYGYGSIVNSCSLKESDLDVTIVTDGVTVDERSMLDFVYVNAIKKFEKNPEYKIEKLLMSNVRFPLLDIIKNKKGKVSLTVNNQLGVANSKLIETYMQICPRARILTLLVKIWAKVHKRTGAKMHYPTSYAYNLLVISFLQKTEPPVLPSLQKISRDITFLDVKRRIRDEIQEFKTRIDFETNSEVLSNIMKNQFSKNEMNVIQLLDEFFKFVCYKSPGDYQFSIKDGDWYPKTDMNDFLFSLEDPFDLKHDPGCHLKMNSPQARELIDDMKKSINLIERKKIKELFLPFN